MCVGGGGGHDCMVLYVTTCACVANQSWVSCYRSYLPEHCLVYVLPMLVSFNVVKSLGDVLFVAGRVQ